MNFIALVAELDSPIGYRSDLLQESIYAHAALMSMISSAEPELGKKLHDTQRNKHVTLSIVRDSSKSALLRLTFFGEDSLNLAETSINILTRTSTLRLGQQDWSVGSTRTCDSPWAATASWSDILAPSSAAKVSFYFDTPTAFSKNDTRGNRIVSLLPDPATLFTGLAWKWRSIGGEPLPAEFSEYISSGGCVISAHKLNTTSVKLTDRAQVGFLGAVTYECRYSDRACITAINRLTRLAYFSGCGFQVSRGMGTVRTKLHDSQSEAAR